MESFLYHSAKKFGRGTTLLCCVSETFWQRESFQKDGEGVSIVSVHFFCLTVPKILLGDQPFCAAFQKISGSEKVLKKRGKEYQEFSRRVFCLTVPNNLAGEQLFCAVF